MLPSLQLMALWQANKSCRDCDGTISGPASRVGSPRHPKAGFKSGFPNKRTNSNWNLWWLSFPNTSQKTQHEGCQRNKSWPKTWTHQRPQWNPDSRISSDIQNNRTHPSFAPVGCLYNFVRFCKYVCHCLKLHKKGRQTVLSALAMWKMMTWWGGTTPCESFPFFPNMFFCQGEIFSVANRCQQHTCTTSERWLIGSAVHRAIAGASSPGFADEAAKLSEQIWLMWNDTPEITKSYGWLEFPPTAICSGLQW